MANRVGVDMFGSHNSSTLSRLVPVSRDPTAQLTTQLRHRKTPEEYRPAAPNQSSGTIEQQRATELGDEMRTVQSIYAARVGDQDLSPTVRDMYQLVTTLAAKAVPESDAHLDSSIEKANMVRTIDRFVRETTSDSNTALSELSSRTRDTRLFRFHAHLGDYAGNVCNLLKENEQFSNFLSREWTKTAKALDAHQDRVTSWTARGRRSPEPTCPEMDAIEVAVQQIIDAGTTELDTDTALLAIRTYARRNFIGHGGFRDMSLPKDSARLVEYIDKDDKLLEEILPDEEKHTVDNWRKILMIHRSSDIWQSGGGERKDKDPPEVALRKLPPPPGRLGRAVLRTQFEMGLRRGSNYPDGPPPTNMKFDPSLHRRRSDPGRRRKSKRPAVEQPPGEPSSKRAKGPYYISDLEAIPEEDIKEDSVREAEELQLELHTLAARLAQTKPGSAIQEFKQHIAKMESKLESVKARIIKIKRARAKKQKKPTGF